MSKNPRRKSTIAAAEAPALTLHMRQSEWSGQWYWHFKAKNGQIVNGPGEGFKRLAYAIDSVWLLLNGLGAYKTIGLLGVDIDPAIYESKSGFKVKVLGIIDNFQKSC